VTPATATATPGGTVQFSAAVAADNDVTDKSVKWASSATSIATVDAAGKATAVTAGTATISATSNFTPSVSGSAVLTVSTPVNVDALLGTFNVSASKSTDTGCNFSNSFTGQVQLSGNSDGTSLTARMIERLTRVYAGTMAPQGSFSSSGTGDLNGFSYSGTLTGQVTGNTIQGVETLNFTTGCPGRQVVYQFSGSK
jgi:uncharacterized protein YjdB